MKRRPINASNQDDGQGQITRVIMAALWSAKEVMVLSVMRLTIHLPFFLMESRQRDTSNLAFYFQWGLLSGPIFDSICFVGCSKTLRQLIALKYKCGNRIQPLSESGPRQCHTKLTSQMEQVEQGCIQDRKNLEAKHGLDQNQGNQDVCQMQAEQGINLDQRNPGPSVVQVKPGLDQNQRNQEACLVQAEQGIIQDQRNPRPCVVQDKPKFSCNKK